MASILWLKFKQMRSDVIMYVIMLVMTLVLTFVFSGAIFGEYNTQRVFVTDNDQTEASQKFLNGIDTGTYTLEYMDADEAERRLINSESIAAVEIPAGFGEGLQTGDTQLSIVKTSENADVMALENALKSAANEAAHAYGLHERINEQLGALDIKPLTLETVEEMYAARMGENAIAQTETSVLGTEDYDEKYAGDVHFLMGFNIFFVMFSIVFTIGSILEDKKLGTWNRVRITPVGAPAIFGGNMIPTFLVGALQMAIVLVGGQYVFGLDLGDSMGIVFVVFLAYSLTVTCMGLLLATALGTYEQLNAAVPVIIVATSMLGGCMWPLDIVPQALQTIAKFTPQYWALSAAETLPVQGGGWAAASLSIYVLLGMAAVFFGLSMLFFRRKQKS